MSKQEIEYSVERLPEYFAQFGVVGEMLDEVLPQRVGRQEPDLTEYERLRWERIRELRHEELDCRVGTPEGAPPRNDVVGEVSSDVGDRGCYGSSPTSCREEFLPPENASPSQLTKLGTPVSPRWSEDWIELVEETEERLGRRCCGAHAPDDLPCELQSTHENGRCRFHGGAQNSGAQKGNANARIHGLYSKRLQRCGNHCTLWKTCPHGGDDVDALPPQKRPYCPYEVEELEALRELDRSAHVRYVPMEERDLDELRRKPYPMYTQLLMHRENLNMLQVQISRAARMLTASGYETEGVRQTENKYEVLPRVSPVFQAYSILQREFRLALRNFNHFIEQYGMPKYERP